MYVSNREKFLISNLVIAVLHSETHVEPQRTTANRTRGQTSGVCPAGRARLGIDRTGKPELERRSAMHRRVATTVLILLIAATGMVAAEALPEGEIELVLDLDGDAFEDPEGVAVDKQGNVFLSAAHLGQVWQLTPDGELSVLFGGLDGSVFGVVGLAVDAPGNVFAAVASLNPATSGV
jgi:hypothetical protein